MRKVMTGMIYLLFVLTILFPVGTLIAACFGYTFKLISVLAFAVAIAVLSVCIVVLVLLFKCMPETSFVRVLLAIITPLTLINAALYMFECSQLWVVAGALVAVSCSCFLSVKYGKPLVLKVIALILSALMVLPLCLFSFIILVFGNLSQNTVVQTVESPSGKYYAQVIDSDQGALGGNTVVNVYENGVINVIIFGIEKKPQRVYLGQWGAFRNMQLHWKDDGCLVINSVEYKIE